MRQGRMKVMLPLLLLLMMMVAMVLNSASGNQEPSRTRPRREAKILSPKERKIVVDLHNKLRRQEGAANMELMVRKVATVSVISVF